LAVAGYLGSLGRMRPRQKVQATVISVKVKPNSRVSVLMQAEDGAWLAQLKSAPVDGKANEELVSLVANHFRCRKSAVSLKSGASARTKLIQIEGPSLAILKGSSGPQRNAKSAA
jgi:uncharacterized protein (TIGR00251 family)